MYIIIIGCGRVGSRLARLLSADENDVVIIDTESAKLKEVDSEFDGITIIGDGTDQDIMKKAGASKADVFVATTDDDNVNLMACQVAKQVFNIKRVIARVNDPTREQTFKDLKIDATVCPTSIAATHFKNAIMHSDLIASIGGENIEISEIKIKGQAGGKALKDIDLPKESTIVTIIREKNMLTPSEDTVLQDGDVAIVLNLTGISKEVRKILGTEE